MGKLRINKDRYTSGFFRVYNRLRYDQRNCYFEKWKKGILAFSTFAVVSNNQRSRVADKSTQDNAQFAFFLIRGNFELQAIFSFQAALPIRSARGRLALGFSLGTIVYYHSYTQISSVFFTLTHNHRFAQIRSSCFVHFVHLVRPAKIRPVLIMLDCFAMSRVFTATARFLGFGGIYAHFAVKMPWWACKRVKRGMSGLLTIIGLQRLTMGGRIVNL